MAGLDLAAAFIPVLFLIWLITKRRGLSASVALPLAAAVLYVLQLIYFKASLNTLHAAVLDGLLTALTPLSIIWGAIFLFKTMEHSGALRTISGWLNQITANRVGQLMIVGWSFSFLIEGISGFGTPAVLAAPLLVGLGYAAVPVAVFCLIMNSAPVSFGAVGTPVWFGFSELSFAGGELLELGFKTALIHTAASLVIPLLALRLVVSWQEIKKNILFIYLAILSSVLPYLILAQFSVEFPSILGGLVGLVSAVIVAKTGLGLAREESKPHSDRKPISAGALTKALFPIWATVLILLISHVPYFGIQEWLVEASPHWRLNIGSVGEVQISPSLVFQLQHIFGTEINWKHAALYVPSFLPFGLVSVICFALFKMPMKTIQKTWEETWNRLGKAVTALLGAMVFVKLFMLGGESSSASIIGRSLANVAGEGWQFVAVYLGALGAFFSGSNTVSNLTFGGIQDSIATNLSLDRTTILALQSAGGAMGGMICIHNIVAVSAVLGLHNQEGSILRKTFAPMLVYGVIAGLVSIFI